MSLFSMILTVFLTCCFISSGATSGKSPSKRSTITAFPDAPRFAEVFRSRDPSENIVEKFLEDEDNKAFTITQNGDYVFQIPLLEHESSEDYYDYDEPEDGYDDEDSSNEIDRGTVKKDVGWRNGDAVEVPEYIVKFFIEQKMLREQREKESRCKDGQGQHTTTTTTFEPDYDTSFFVQSDTKFPLETIHDVTNSETNELPHTSDDKLGGAENEEDLGDDFSLTHKPQSAETTSQNHVTSTEATPMTTIPSKAPHPRWNSVKNIFSSVSKYQPHPSRGSLIENVDRFISKIFNANFRNKRSASAKGKFNRRPFRDLLYQIVPRKYAKRYIAPKYFPKANLVASEVYPVLTKKILQNELEDLSKAKTGHQTENLSTMDQFRTLEDIFKHESRSHTRRRNKRPIDFVGSFEQVL